jgi:tetrahydromethanopterin S-methyltransferase subunit C
MSQSLPAPKADTKQGLAVAGLACGIVAFFFLPPVFGTLGIVFGAISWKAGNKLGIASTIVSIVGLIVGMVVGAVVWTSILG